MWFSSSRVIDGVGLDLYPWVCKCMFGSDLPEHVAVDPSLIRYSVLNMSHDPLNVDIVAERGKRSSI